MKLRSLIGLVLIIILVFASAYTVIFGLDFGMYSFEPMRAINLGIDVYKRQPEGNMCFFYPARGM